MHLSYSPVFLKQLRKQLKTKHNTVSTQTMQTLKRLSIASRRVIHYRGCRGKRLAKRRPLPRQHLLVSGKTPQRSQLNPNARKYDFPIILLCNARSLSNKMDEFESNIQLHNVQVAAITETWFTDHNSWLMNMEGFNLYNRPRSEGRGGGVALYVSSDIESCLAEDIENHDLIETLWVILKPKYLPRNTSVIACCITYLPPKSKNVNLVIDHIITSADTIRNRYPDVKLVIMGDFNRAKLDQLSRLLQLKKFVKKPTRGSVTLDLIFSDIDQSNYTEATILPPLGSSDHSMVLWKPLYSKKVCKAVSVKRRPLPQSVMNAFGRWITTHDWSAVCASHDPQSINTTLESVLRYKLDLLAPTKSCLKRVNNKPWYTPQLQQLKRERDKCFRRNDKSSEYKKLRNKLNRMCKKAKATFYNTQLGHANHSNPKKWYRHIKQAARLTRSSFTLPVNDCNRQACDVINDHFSEICRSLPPLDAKQFPAVLPTQQPLPTITEFEVYKCLQSVNPAKSTAANDLPPKIIKEFAAELTRPLCHLFNASLGVAVV